MSERVCFQNAVLLDPERSAPRPGGLLTEAGRILRCLDPEEAGPEAATRVDCGGSALAPGLIDLHVHGALVLGGDARRALRQAGASQVRHGVTAYLPTTVAWARHELAKRVEELARAIAAPDPSAARPLGLHLEGPWISARAAGAQPPHGIRAYDRGEGREVLAAAQGTLRMVTLAPEAPGAELLLEDLALAEVVPAMGHTLAGPAAFERAVGLGARHVTHLYNAMGAMHHRGPGFAALALAEDGVTCDLIADGAHVHPAWVRVAARAKGAALCLITDRVGSAPTSGDSDDAAQAAHDAPDAAERGCCGGPPARGSGFGSGALSSDGVAWRLPDGTLAGSRLTLDRAIQNAVAWGALDRLTAIAACTLAPARVLGLEHEMGTLRPGARADLVLLDPAGAVRETWVGGRRVHPPAP